MKNKKLFIILILLILLLGFSKEILAYESVCWSCNHKISSSFCSKCNECNWYICIQCDACIAPQYGKCSRYQEGIRQFYNNFIIIVLIIIIIVYLFNILKKQYLKIQYKKLSKKRLIREQQIKEEIQKELEAKKQKEENYKNEIYNKYNIKINKNAPPIYEILNLVNNLKNYNINYNTDISFEENKKIYLLAEKDVKLGINFDTQLSYTENLIIYNNKKNEIKHKLIEAINAQADRKAIKTFLKHIDNISFSKNELIILANYYETNTDAVEILKLFNNNGYHYAKIIFKGTSFYVINEKGYNETIYKIDDIIGNFIKY